jgi:uracil-DNA glycosylase family 4
MEEHCPLMPDRDTAARVADITVLNTDVVACTRCSRLVGYREQTARERKKAFADQEYWGKPVPSFGDPDASVMIVGLAPAAHGSNRTGRMFTGDGTDGMGAGDFLMRALHAAGFASLPYSHHPGDGLSLEGLYIAAAVRCAPPENKPLPEEIGNCREYLVREIELLDRLRVAVALGRLAFDQLLKLAEARGADLGRPRPKFGHGVTVGPFRDFPIILASYHPSRQNTQTGLLSGPMLEEIFLRARRIAESGIPES